MKAVYSPLSGAGADHHRGVDVPSAHAPEGLDHTHLFVISLLVRQNLVSFSRVILLVGNG